MIKGCTTATACNYNSEAKEDDNSCIDPLGCDNWCPSDTTDVKELDCAGICGGIQFIDCSGQCGILIADDCGVCGGNNAICTDCNGVINGDAFIDPHYNIDNCKTNECVGGNTGLEACIYDCNGYWGGDAQLDACGVCGGTNTDDSQCTECPNGQALGCDNTCYLAETQPLNDECNVCGGDNTICAGCDGIPNSGSVVDVCGMCRGDGNCLPENCTENNVSGYCQDLSVLQILIDNSLETINMYYMDVNEDGVIEPLELGVQEWVNGRLTLFRCDLIKGDMDICGLSGEIPESMSNLTNLTSLTLGGNELSGEIPESIGNLINLTNLLLTGDQLTGEIPSEIGNLTSLTSLNLFGTQLTGEIPSEIGNLVNLQVLSFNDNELSGEIPPEIWSLVNLTSLSLEANEFTGEIPSEIGSLTSLAYLNLWANQLTGEIPSEIGSLTNLIVLNLSGNQLTGEIPTEICNLDLDWFSLNDNKLCPPYPECIEESGESVGEQDISECEFISISGRLKDWNGNNIENAAILLTYDLTDFNGRIMSQSNMPTTTIDFLLPTETNVLLFIEDMCGDTINILVDEILNAGYYSIAWDASGVLEGQYFARLITSEYSQTQILFLALLYYSDLEMIDGELIQTLPDTSYTHNYHAMTDVDGKFSIPLDCLSFGFEQIGVDEFGNPTDNWTIPYRAKLWIVNEGDAMFSTQPHLVDPDNGLYVEITTPY